MAMKPPDINCFDSWSYYCSHFYFLKYTKISKEPIKYKRTTWLGSLAPSHNQISYKWFFPGRELSDYLFINVGIWRNHHLLKLDQRSLRDTISRAHHLYVDITMEWMGWKEDETKFTGNHTAGKRAITPKEIHFSSDHCGFWFSFCLFQWVVFCSSNICIVPKLVFLKIVHSPQC